MIEKQLEYHEVLQLLKYEVNEICVIKLSGNKEIKCTSTHPIYVANKDKWCCVEPTMFNPKVEKLEIDDEFISDKGDRYRVIEIDYEYFDDTVPVYTLHIEDVHNFYANGILVHNAMEIYVRNNTSGKRITINVEPNDSIKSVKKKIWSMENIQPKYQILICSGKQMEDDRNLNDYYIHNKQMIEMILKDPIQDDKDQGNGLMV